MKPPFLRKTPLQNSLDQANPEYNRYSRIHFNSGLLIKRRDETQRRTSVSFRLLKSKDKISSKSFSNISSRTVSKKIQRNDDSGMFSDDKFKRSEILIVRKKGDSQANKMPEILTQTSYPIPLPPKQQLSSLLLGQKEGGSSSLRARKETLRRMDVEERQSMIVYPEIGEKERSRLYIRKENFSRKGTNREKRREVTKLEDINRWEKQDFAMGPTTIEQYIQENVVKGSNKIRRKYNKKIFG